ncbi:MAG: hypothetical protein EOO41_01190, partial [Methanobacteriota archaeon]
MENERYLGVATVEQAKGMLRELRIVSDAFSVMPGALHAQLRRVSALAEWLEHVTKEHAVAAGVLAHVLTSGLTTSVSTVPEALTRSWASPWQPPASSTFMSAPSHDFPLTAVYRDAFIRGTPERLAIVVGHHALLLADAQEALSECFTYCLKVTAFRQALGNAYLTALPVSTYWTARSVDSRHAMTPHMCIHVMTMQPMMAAAASQVPLFTRFLGLLVLWQARLCATRQVREVHAPSPSSSWFVLVGGVARYVPFFSQLHADPQLWRLDMGVYHNTTHQLMVLSRLRDVGNLMLRDTCALALLSHVASIFPPQLLRRVVVGHVGFDTEFPQPGFTHGWYLHTILEATMRNASVSLLTSDATTSAPGSARASSAMSLAAVPGVDASGASMLAPLQWLELRSSCAHIGRALLAWIEGHDRGRVAGDEPDSAPIRTSTFSVVPAAEASRRGAYGGRVRSRHRVSGHSVSTHSEITHAIAAIGTSLTPRCTASVQVRVTWSWADWCASEADDAALLPLRNDFVGANAAFAHALLLQRVLGSAGGAATASHTPAALDAAVDDVHVDRMLAVHMHALRVVEASPIAGIVCELSLLLYARVAALIQDVPSAAENALWWRMHRAQDHEHSVPQHTRQELQWLYGTAPALAASADEEVDSSTRFAVAASPAAASTAKPLVPIMAYALLEWPLRCVVLVRQMQARMWIRNGDISVALPSASLSPGASLSAFLPHLEAMQMALCMLPPHAALAYIVHKFELLPWFEGRAGPAAGDTEAFSPSLLPLDRLQVYLVGFFSTLSQLVSEVLLHEHGVVSPPDAPYDVVEGRANAAARDACDVHPSAAQPRSTPVAWNVQLAAPTSETDTAGVVGALAVDDAASKAPLFRQRCERTLVYLLMGGA